MDVVLAQPRGFCAGVDRAIEIVERALENFGGPVYVRHEIVHNDHVVGELRTKGAVFVDSVDDVPDGAVLIFSAHGVSRAVRTKAEARDFGCLTPPVLWSPRFMSKCRKCARKGASWS